MSSPRSSFSVPRGRAALVALAALIVAAVVLFVLVRDDSGTPASAKTTPVRAAVKLVSRGDLRPPEISVFKRSGHTEKGLIVLGPKKVFGAKKVAGAQQGPEIVDDRGRVRWFRPLTGGQSAYDVRVQTYEGKPVLTWWQGKAIKGSGRGAGMIYDTSYRLVKRVTPGAGAVADIHEFLLTPRGTALMLVYEQKKHDLSSVGGKKDDWVVDGVVEEIDVKTGKVLMRWSALDHVGLDESYEPIKKRYGKSWDYMHLNSIDVDTDGNLLVSARHTWTVYKIDRQTGNVIWRLGGKRSDLALGKGVEFAWQHDARAQSPGVVRIFDNDAASKPVRPHSEVMTVKIDEAAKTATLLKSIEHPKGLSSGTQGNAQLLPNGDTFVGWGSQGYFSEFDRHGRMLFDARVPKGYDSYRAYRAQWKASPTERPRVSTRSTRRGTSVYASWNGSTEVARWQALAGSSRKALRRSGSPRAWSGLETRLTVSGRPSYVAVQALDRSGKVLATSPTVAVKG